jgi:hypothetical protein
MNAELTWTQFGTAAFPIYSVCIDYTDEQGFLLEHLTKELARFPSRMMAEKFISENQHSMLD